MKTITFNRPDKYFLPHFEHLKQIGSDFKVVLTSYTSTIEQVKGKTKVKQVYAKEMTPFSVFQLSNKVKKDISESKIHIDEIDKKTINYFMFDKMPTLKMAYCIDINSAYPTALKNMNLISDKVFENLQEAEKKDRLKSIGMLATLKQSLEYKSGKAINKSYEINRCEYSNYFFAVQKEIGDIISEIKNRYKEYFLFFWFDGIYFHSETPKEILENILVHLKSIGYESKLEILKNLHTKKNHIIYEKEGKKKILPIIKPNNYTIFEKNKTKLNKNENWKHNDKNGLQEKV